VDLSWLEVLVKEIFWGMGGRVEVILPSLAGTHQSEMNDLSEISAKGYELMGNDGRGKIDELLEAGFALGSEGVAGSVLSVLQRSGKEGTSFAIGTMGRGELLKRQGDMELSQATRCKKGGGGRSEGPLRAAPRQALRAEDEGGSARAIGAALGQNLSMGTIAMNQNHRAGQLLMGRRALALGTKKTKRPSTPRSSANKGRAWWRSGTRRPPWLRYSRAAMGARAPRF
jgi:hypothetical protein